MFNRLDAIEEKYNELTKDLANPEILNDFNKVKELSKEQSDLEETVKTYQSYKQAKNNLEEAKIMENDPELREIALEEIDNLTKEIDKLYHELEVLLVPKDENDGKNVIIEIRGAAGGAGRCNGRAEGVSGYSFHSGDSGKDPALKTGRHR